MKDYRLYLLDAFSGHIEEVREFEAADDDDALRRARALGGDRAMELWHRQHKIKHWDQPFALPE